MNNCDIFLIFAQNIDRGHTLEVPTIYVLEQKYVNKVYPCTSQFYYIKVGFDGVLITRPCYPNVLVIVYQYITPNNVVTSLVSQFTLRQLGFAKMAGWTGVCL